MERHAQRFLSPPGTTQSPGLPHRKSLRNLFRRYFGESSTTALPPSTSLVTHRVPVEVWEIILLEAIKSPLFPFTESGDLPSSFLSTSLVFLPHCSIFCEYRDTTRLTTEQLRLVCRTWADILQPYTVPYALTSLEAFSFPSNWARGRPTTFVSNAHDLCSCSTMANSTCPLFSAHKKNSPIDIEDVPVDALLHVRVLILEGRSEASGLDLLHRFPSVRALSLSSYDVKEDWSLSKIFLTANQISHLEITRIHSERDRIVSEDIELPRLRSLSLSFGSHGEANQDYLKSWKFPNLHTLHVHGVSSPLFTDQVYRFAARYKDSLKEVIDTRRYRSHYSGDMPRASFWSACPNVTTLGIELEKYSRCRKENWESRDASLPLLTLFVFDFHLTWSEPKWNITLFENLRSKLNIEKIVSIYSWEELKRKRSYLLSRLAEKELARKKADSKTLAKMLVKANIPIFDRLGASLADDMVTLHS
ncbi:hypothetical protein CPB86DRAFT_783533 [Serendipita vermifera]|nr:hypothetical protein CPB86DRAFT_783533 [Serendipita vermifera]